MDNLLDSFTSCDTSTNYWKTQTQQADLELASTTLSRYLPWGKFVESLWTKNRQEKQFIYFRYICKSEIRVRNLFICSKTLAVIQRTFCLTTVAIFNLFNYQCWWFNLSPLSSWRGAINLKRKVDFMKLESPVKPCSDE